MRKEYARGKDIEATTGYIVKLTEDGEYEVTLTNAFRAAVAEAMKKQMDAISGVLEPLAALPDTDGTYVMTCDVADGDAEITWESAE